MLYMITDEDGNFRHVEADTIAEAVLAWKEEHETEDEPDAVATLGCKPVIRRLRAHRGQERNER